MAEGQDRAEGLMGGRVLADCRLPGWLREWDWRNGIKVALLQGVFRER